MAPISASLSLDDPSTATYVSSFPSPPMTMAEESSSSTPASTSIPTTPTHRAPDDHGAKGTWRSASTIIMIGGSAVATSSMSTITPRISTSSPLSSVTPSVGISSSPVATSSASSSTSLPSALASSKDNLRTSSAVISSSVITISTSTANSSYPEPESPSAASDHFSKPVLAGVIVICAVLLLAFGAIMLWRSPFRPSKPETNIEAVTANHDANGSQRSASNRNSQIYTQSAFGNGSPPTALGKVKLLAKSVPWGVKQGVVLPGRAMSRNQAIGRSEERRWWKEPEWSRPSALGRVRCPLGGLGYSKKYGERVKDEP